MNPPAATIPAPPEAVFEPIQIETIGNGAEDLWTIVHRRAAAAWSTAAPPSPDLGASEDAHLARIRAVLLDLDHIVHDALADHVPSASIDLALRPVLADVRTALHAPERSNEPVDLDLFEPEMCGGYPDNLDRAAWAAEAVRVFGLRTRQIGPHNGACVDGVEEMAADLICDLMHLVDAIGGNAEYTVERGLGYHLDEVEEEVDDDNLSLAAGTAALR
ncbi:hypothetical protein GCM10009839_58880 [Catenulispora yoronensis]|uniref:DUF4254 domain-containing protein n=1 Tax=Catenulispora yoronensis TaxID=450799 RepID=A0ABN2V2B0_9ACTN